MGGYHCNTQAHYWLSDKRSKWIGGGKNRCLSVCLSVCLFVNTITQERVEIHTRDSLSDAIEIQRSNLIFEGS